MGTSTILENLHSRHRDVLRKEGITTNKALKNIFLSQESNFIWTKKIFWTKSQSEMSKGNFYENFHLAIAKRLLWEKLISDEEYEKQYPLKTFHLRKQSLAFFEKEKIQTIGDAVRRCIKNGEFHPLNKRAVASHYQLAKILNKKGFLSNEAFSKVILPEGRERMLTDEEMGEDAKMSLNEMLEVYNLKISKEARELIALAIDTTFKITPGDWKLARMSLEQRFAWIWNESTVSQFVQAFIRVRTLLDNNKTHLRRTGFLKWYSAYWRWDYEKIRGLLPEIEAVLQKMNYLE